MEITVGIGDYKVSDKEEDFLRTYALASCIAVTVYSPAKKVAGMLHIALPEPHEGEMDINPAYYATTGIPLLINKMCLQYGCVKSDLLVHLYGGAESICKDDIFNIGRKNIHAVNKTPENLKLAIHKSEVGGRVSRTLSMNVTEGEIKVKYQSIRI